MTVAAVVDVSAGFPHSASCQTHLGDAVILINQGCRPEFASLGYLSTQFRIQVAARKVAASEGHEIGVLF